MSTVVASRLETPTTVEALTPGLLLFFDRPSFLQSWAERFGHEWRHVGITVATDEGVKIANYAHPQMFHHLPIELLAKYRRIGVARVFSTDEEIELLHTWCAQFEAKETSEMSYTLCAPLAGMVLLLSRRLVNRWLKRLVLALPRLYCAWQTRRFRDRPAFICSSFAWTAVHAARVEPLEVPMSALDLDQANAVVSTSLLDVKLSRWLCGPTDLWRSIPRDQRWDLDLTDAAATMSPVVDVGFAVAETAPTAPSPAALSPADSNGAEDPASGSVKQAWHSSIAAVAALLSIGSLLSKRLPPVA